jgi:type II secretory pathway component GspD/PulD (secretin)
MISGDSERFIPFTSIRSIYRSANLELSSPFPLGRSRPSQAASSAAQMTTIQLRNAKATELAEVIKKLYSDIDLKITADTDRNTLRLESRDQALRPIQQLIEALDAKVDAHARAADRSGD